MAWAVRTLRRVSVPQRLLLASAFAYGGVFAGLLAYGRPGLGVGQAFCIPVMLAAVATSPLAGAVYGAGALVLYELALHASDGLTWGNFAEPGALVRLLSFVAAGSAAGFLATRGRRMLAQALHVLDDLLEIAHRDTDTAAARGFGLERALGRRASDDEPALMFVTDVDAVDSAAASAACERLLALLGADLTVLEVARVSSTRFALLAGAGDDCERDLARRCRRAIAEAGAETTLGWATFPSDGRDAFALYGAAVERLHERASAARA